MKITTRNLLADMLLAALDDRIAAEAVHCLARYCRAIRRTPPAMAVDTVLQSAREEEREQVLAKLRENPLLSWDLRGRSGRVTLSTSFSSEWAVIVERLLQFDAALREWSPTKHHSPLTQALRKGIILFNHRLFFEVHEVLETQWLQATDPEKQFLQGLIQLAVAFHHLENHNPRGARSLLQDGIAKLLPYRPAFLGVELQEVIQELEICRAELSQLDEEKVAQPHLVGIPTLRFVQV
jgi:predicted metal-dependent hydrolase